MLGSIFVSSDLGIGSEFVVDLLFSIEGKVDFVYRYIMKGYCVVVVI